MHQLLFIIVFILQLQEMIEEMITLDVIEDTIPQEPREGDVI